MGVVGELQLDGHPGFEPGHILVSSVLFMAEQARYAAENDAHSYRGFKVGAAAFVLNAERQETAILAAGNLKSSRHTGKVCAEKKVLQQAKKVGYTWAAALLVAGTTDKELIVEVTDAATSTLHPCAECRIAFDTHPLMREDTLIITTGLQLDTYQVHTQAELRKLYESGSLPDGQAPVRNFGNWQHRIAAYDYMSLAERQLPLEQQRPMSMLAKMALLA